MSLDASIDVNGTGSMKAKLPPGIPIITGQVRLATSYNTPITLKMSDFVVINITDAFPDMYTLTAVSCIHGSISDLDITPDVDYDGVMTVAVMVSIGEVYSQPFIATVTVARDQFLSFDANLISYPITGDAQYLNGEDVAISVNSNIASADINSNGALVRRQRTCFLRRNTTLTSSVWYVTPSPHTIARTTGVPDPEGGTAAWNLNVTTGGDEFRQDMLLSNGVLDPATYDPSLTYTSSFYLRLSDTFPNPTSNALLKTPDGSTYTAITITKLWQQFSATGLGKSTGLYFNLHFEEIGNYEIYKPMVNDGESRCAFVQTDSVPIISSAGHCLMQPVDAPLIENGGYFSVSLENPVVGDYEGYLWWLGADADNGIGAYLSATHITLVKKHGGASVPAQSLASWPIPSPAPDSVLCAWSHSETDGMSLQVVGWSMIADSSSDAKTARPEGNKLWIGENGIDACDNRIGRWYTGDFVLPSTDTTVDSVSVDYATGMLIVTFSHPISANAPVRGVTITNNTTGKKINKYISDVTPPFVVGNTIIYTLDGGISNGDEIEFSLVNNGLTPHGHWFCTGYGVSPNNPTIQVAWTAVKAYDTSHSTTLATALKGIAGYYFAANCNPSAGTYDFSSITADLAWLADAGNELTDKLLPICLATRQYMGKTGLAWTQSGTTVTVTCNNHGFTTAEAKAISAGGRGRIYHRFLTGTNKPADGWYTLTRDTANIYHFTVASSNTTSGTCAHFGYSPFPEYLTGGTTGYPAVGNPGALVAPVIKGTTSIGWAACVWQPAYVDWIVNLINALCDPDNGISTHANLAYIRLNESSIGFVDDATGNSVDSRQHYGYTTTLYMTALKKIGAAWGKNLTRHRIDQQLNFINSDSNYNQNQALENVALSNAAWGVTLGQPDILPLDNTLQTGIYVIDREAAIDGHVAKTASHENNSYNEEVNGTYSRVGAVITVTMAMVPFWVTAGSYQNLSFSTPTTGAPANGMYLVASVASGSFTLTTASSSNVSGACALYRPPKQQRDFAVKTTFFSDIGYNGIGVNDILWYMWKTPPGYGWDDYSSNASVLANYTAGVIINDHDGTTATNGHLRPETEDVYRIRRATDGVLVQDGSATCLVTGDNGNYDPNFTPGSGDYLYIDLNALANGTGLTLSSPVNVMPSSIGNRKQVLFNSDNGVQIVPPGNNRTYINSGSDIQISSYGSGRACISGYQLFTGGWEQVGASNVWKRTISGTIASVIDTSSTTESPQGDILTWTNVESEGGKLATFIADPTVLSVGAYAYDYTNHVMYINVGANPNSRAIGISSMGNLFNTASGTASTTRVRIHNLRIIGFGKSGINVQGNSRFWRIHDIQTYGIGGCYTAGTNDTNSWYSGTGIQLSQNARDIEIDNNVFRQTFDSPISPQHFYGASGNDLRGIHIHDNDLGEWALAAVECADFGTGNSFSQITIEDNTAILCGQGFSGTGDTPQGYSDGIQMRKGSNTTVTDLIIRRNTIHAVKSNIVYEGNFTNAAIVDDNVCYGGEYGIRNKSPTTAYAHGNGNMLCNNSVSHLTDTATGSSYTNTTTSETDAPCV